MKQKKKIKTKRNKETNMKLENYQLKPIHILGRGSNSFPVKNRKLLE